MTEENSGPLEVPGKPGRKKKISEEVKKLSRSEKVRNYCIGLGALSALILGLVANFKGEPVAQKATEDIDKTWRKLRFQVNKQSDAINKLHLRMVHFQGTQEGFTAGKLQEKLELIQKKYDELAGSQPKKVAKLQQAKKPTAVAAKPAPKPKKECPPGRVEAEGRCRKVTKAVAKRVAKDSQKVAEAQRKLAEERRRREELERKKRALERKMTQQKQQAVPKLSPLPAKLDDA